MVETHEPTTSQPDYWRIKMSDVETNTVTKTCTVCKEVKPITDFSMRKSTKGVLQSRCKECTNSYSKAWYEKNKEKRNALSNAWYEANKEKHNLNSKTWYEENKEKRNASIKAWADANKERLSLSRKAWYLENADRRAAAKKAWNKANPEKTLSYCRNRRALKKAADGSHTGEDIKNLLILQKSKCAVCRKSIANGYEVDHIVALSKGGSNDKYNLQLLCKPCNRSKRDVDPVDFMQSKGMLL